MEKQMLRYTLEELRNKGLLLECNKEVDSTYEMGAVLKHFNNKQPILFNKIKNNKMSSIGGLYGDRNIIYDLLGMNHENRINKFMEGIVNPKPYKLLNSGPIKENIIKRNIDLQKIFNC